MDLVGECAQVSYLHVTFDQTDRGLSKLALAQYKVGNPSVWPPHRGELVIKEEEDQSVLVSVRRPSRLIVGDHVKVLAAAGDEKLLGLGRQEFIKPWKRDPTLLFSHD